MWLLCFVSLSSRAGFSRPSAFFPPFCGFLASLAFAWLFCPLYIYKSLLIFRGNGNVGSFGAGGPADTPRGGPSCAAPSAYRQRCRCR